MQGYTRKVYLNGVKELAKKVEALTDSQLDRLRDKFSEIIEMVRLYEIENNLEKTNPHKG